MKRVSKKVSVMIISLVLFLVAIIVAFPKVNSLITKSKLDSETLRAMTYDELEEEDYETQSENVEFSAFFTRDLDNDGYAERIKGSSKEIGTTNETLWAEIKVSKSGYLKNGRITLNAKNFDWTTAIVEDTVVSGNYIGKTTGINLKEKVYSGSQKLFEGKISSKIGNDINDYSRVSSITLTGTYVDDNNNETAINVTREVTVDWYGSVKAGIISTNQTGSISYDNGMNVNFKISGRDSKNQLILKDNVTTAQAPIISGYYPTSATVAGLNQSNYSYDPETGLLTITKSSTVNEDGRVTSKLSSPITYNVTLNYPTEAIPLNTSEDEERSFKVEIPVTTKFTAYNNQNKEFDNIVESEANGIIAFTDGKKGSGTIVDEAQVTVGELSKNRRIVSKEKAVQAYNFIETENDYYEVEWHCLTERFTDKVTLKENKPDEFLFNNRNLREITDIVKYKGIYFSISGSVSEVRIYNADTDELIKTFSTTDVSSFSKGNPYLYEEDIKNIKIEADGISKGANFDVYHIKEIDDESLVEKISKEEFNNIAGIYSYLWIKRDINGVETGDSTFTGYAEYREQESEVSISITPNNLETKNLNNTQTIKISTQADDFNQLEWKNGEFLIKFPTNVIYAEKGNISIDNNDVEIIAYDIYKEGNNYFAKILTNNDLRTTYQITLLANVVLNPLTPSTYDNYTLYAYNEDCNTYLMSTKDIYDVNSNNNYEENVGFYSISLGITAPSTLLTSETASNYNEEGTVTVAPNIAEVRKEDRTVDINVNVFNNYERTISEIKILGVIPFEGNTFIENDTPLGSQFTSKMTDEGIKIPSNLQGKVTVYYTENESATKDLDNEENGWTTTPEDYSKIKRFLIDFNTTKMSAGGSYAFTYTVEIPEEVKFNEFAFSEHVIYCALDTDEGKLTTQVEPNKLGIRKVRTYELYIRKLNIENLKPVSGAIYKLTEFDDAGNEVSSNLITSNSDGYLLVKKLYVDRKYRLEEIREPSGYMLDESKFEFKVIEDENGELQVQMLSNDNFDNTPVIENEKLVATIKENPRFKLVVTKKDNATDETISGVKFDLSGIEYITNKEGKFTTYGLNQDYEYTLKETYADGYYLLDDINFKLVKENNEFKIESDNEQFKNSVITLDENEDLIKVEVTLYDERQPSILINKIDKETKEPMPGVIFTVDNRGKLYTTDSEGKVLINGFAENTEYTIKEIKADGYYLQEVTFTVVRDNNDKLTIQSDKFKDIMVIDETRKIISVTLENEPIPTYDLKIKKIEEGNENKTLEGAKFQLYSEDKDVSEEYITNEEGIIDIAGLYAYVEGKELTGNYILTELEAPAGYGNCAEEIRFRIVKTENDEYEIQLKNAEDLQTIYKSEFSEGVFNLFIENKPLFTLLKTDKETGMPLKNASFMIKELDLPYDFAKDLNGEYVGTLDEDGNYIVTTDENGKITLSLQNGKYLLIEVGYPEGYEKEDVIQVFEVYTGEKEATDMEISQINCIEDLVELSRQVSWGLNYSGKKVTLNKTLDFNDDSSYEDPNGTKYGDLNKDGITEGIKAELTNKDGIGFTPIGNSTGFTFNGSFDGKNNEIKNLYINNGYEICGLFGTANQIENLGVSGKINYYKKDLSSTGTYSYRCGGIVGSATTLYNCHSDVNIDIINDYNTIGGIAGYASKIENCYNSGNITVLAGTSYGSIGGIAPSCAEITNCYNTGDITGLNNRGYLGGIVAKGSSRVTNCYNVGNITKGSYVGQITSITNTNNAKIFNSYYMESATTSGANVLTYGTSKTSDYMKTQEFVTELNPDAFSLDSENTNNGYPVLKYIDLTDENTDGNSNGNSDETDNNNENNDIDETEYLESIDSIEDLVKISNQVNSGISYKGHNITLEKTLDFNDDSSYEDPQDTSFGDLNGDEVIDGIKTELTKQGESGFIPIGYDNYFEGNFNGNGFEIKNLYINSEYNAGLFGHVKNVTIENITVTGTIENGDFCGLVSYCQDGSISLINCHNKMNINGRESAGLLSYMYSGNVYIENCSNDGNIIANSTCAGFLARVSNASKVIIKNSYNNGNISSVSYRCGGMIGEGYSTVIEISNCYNNGDINSTSDNTGGIIGYTGTATITDTFNTGNITGGRYTGGILGYNSSSDETIISNCYNLGNIEGTEYVGGICGYSGGSLKVTKSFNKGQISKKSSTSSAKLGGICGELHGNNLCIECYNTGDIIADCNSYVYAGGIIGNGISTNTAAINSYNTGNIMISEGSGDVYSGGIVGAYANATNCYNTGNIMIGKRTSSINAAGIIGYTGYAKNCYNTGNISCKSNYGYIGGICGSSTGYAENCYNTGDIEASCDRDIYVGGIAAYNCCEGSGYNTGNITVNALNNAYVGGIVGYKWGNITINSHYNTGNINVTCGYSAYVGGINGYGTSINNSYNAGNISVEVAKGQAYVGGLDGYLGSGTIENCVNTGNISVRKTGDDYLELGLGGLGGCCGSSCSISNSKNTGKITLDSEEYTNGSIYIGGLGGLNFNVTDSYNKGNIDINIVGTASLTNPYSTYIGGVTGSGNATNSINYGNIKLNGEVDRNSTYLGGISGYNVNATGCYNIGDIDVTWLDPYTDNMTNKNLGVGGITGCKISVNNCYSLGNIRVKSKNIGNSGLGRIDGSYPDITASVENYYLNSMVLDGSKSDNYTIVQCGTETPLDTIEVPEKAVDDITDIRSIEYFNELNKDAVWGHLDGYLPKLFIGEAMAIDSVQINVENTIQKFNITTDVDESSGNKGGSITGEDENPFEIVRYGNDNTKDIVMVPDSGYVIESIKINGENYAYQVSEDGTYTINAGDISDIKEDKKIVVKFEKEDQVLVINKVDKDNNSIPLAGAKFNITNGIDDNDVFGKIVSNGTYYFIYNNGDLVPNGGDRNNLTLSYIPIDLTGLEGEYYVSLTGDTQSVCTASITETTDAPTSLVNYTDKVFMYETGYTSDPTEFTSNILEGGRKYYLHLALSKEYSSYIDGIRNIRLFKKSQDNSECIGAVVATNTTRSFVQNEGRVQLDLAGTSSYSASAYIPIDLRNKTGKYHFITNVETNNFSSLFKVLITETPNLPSDTTTPHSAMVYDCKNTGDQNYVSRVLDGGKQYYAHLYYVGGAPNTEIALTNLKVVESELLETYQNNYGDSVDLKGLVTDENGEIRIRVPVTGDYTITEIEAPEGYTLDNTPITYTVKSERENGIIGKLNANATYYFEKKDGKYIPNNVGLSGSSVEAKSYIPIDLTNLEGSYNIIINAQNDSSGALWSDINESPDPISLSTADDFMFIYSHPDSDNFVSKTLTGGKKYYLHIGFTGTSSTSNIAINSIKLAKPQNADKNILKGLNPVSGVDGTFEVINGVISPNNLAQSSPAQAYMELDLTEQKGLYNANINVTTEKSGLLYGQITDNTNALTSTNASDNFLYTYGNGTNKEFVSSVLEGGKKYYLHLAYTGGDPTATVAINSITIKEYATIEEGPINQLTIENKAKQPVIVHHYLKKSDGTYTTIKVAEDDELGVFDVGEKYTTSPKIDLENLELEKDEDGKYVIPSNASGVVLENGVEVNYYYEVKLIELTIHHYLDGTDEKLAEDEKVEYETRVDIEDGKVTDISTEQTYEVEQNAKYRSLLTTYNSTLITQDDEMVENEEIEFTDNSELVYYYAITDSSIEVKYLDKQTSLPIADTDTILGTIGEDYNVDIKEIEGYIFVERDGELTGKFEEETKTIILYYSKNATVTVNYKERITNPETEEVTENLLDTVSANGLVGDQYTAEEKSFTHYRLVERPENATVIMTAEPIVLNYYYEKIKTDVVEKHIDDITNEVLYEETHVGDEGDSYEITSKEFTGYDLVEDKLPENSSGTRNEASIEVIYYYIKQAEVLVQYIDSATDQPIEELTIKGHEGDPYETETKEIEGYDLDETRLPENAEGTMTVTVTTDENDDKVFENQTIVKYYYKYKSKVIERHYDNRTEELIEDEKVTTGHEGDEYNIPAKEFERFVLNEERLPENAEGTMTKEDIIVSYYYKYQSTITTKYVDKDTGEDILPPETKDIFDGEEYETEPKEIEGYDLDEENLPEDAEGTIGKEDKVITYYYTVHVGDAVVTENHIDVMDGNVLASRKISGKVGDPYKTSAKEIAKYDLVEDRLPENAEGIMTEAEIVVNYYYKYRATITTRYVDEDTNKDIGTPEEQEVPEGDKYITTSKEIEGYDLDEDKLPENADGDAPKSDVEVIYYYKKKDEVVEDAKVIAKYVDVITNKELDSKVYNGKVGDSYKTEAKEIEKYDLVGIPENEKGTMTKEDIIVTYYYKYRVTRTVRYVDVETGKDLLDKEVIEVHEGDTYTTKEIEIEGYTLIKKPKNSEGTMTKEDEVVVYYYKKNVDPIIVEKVVENKVEVEKPTTIIKTVKTGDNIIKIAIVFVASIIVAVVAVIKKDNK